MRTVKVLTMFVDEFSYHPAQKNLESSDEITEGRSFSKAILVFIQVEQTDEDNDLNSREKKLVNHLLLVFHWRESGQVYNNAAN